MSTDRSDIAAALADATVIVDVRSPGEYAKGHIAGAVNIPLFSNAERSDIGTLYKQVGQQQAIRHGLEVLGGRLAEFVEAFAAHQGQQVLVYCARGGMRSKAVVSLLDSLGHDVSRLAGGYKAFRNHVLAELERRVPPTPLILHGCTGVGKTLLLERLTNALDLEQLAQHRSSLFGAVGLTPRTQQQFEAELLARLMALDFSQPVWVEGESRKVGDAILPVALRDVIRTGTAVLVTASMETRVQRIIAEYSRDDPAILAALDEALHSLVPHMGRQRVHTLSDALRAGNLEFVVQTLLEEHYDPRYLHAMRGYHYALEINSDDLDDTVARLRAFAAAQGSAAGDAPQRHGLA